MKQQESRTTTTINGSLATCHLKSGYDPSGMGQFSYQAAVRHKKIGSYSSLCTECASKVSALLDHIQHFSSNGTTSKPTDITSLIITNKFWMIYNNLSHECIKDRCNFYLSTMDANKDTKNHYQRLAIFTRECGSVNTHNMIFDDDFFEENLLPLTFLSDTINWLHLLYSKTFRLHHQCLH
jgi:hypothetical protein